MENDHRPRIPAVSALQRRREDFFKGDPANGIMPTGSSNGNPVMNGASSANGDSVPPQHQRVPLSAKHAPPAPLANGESTSISRNGRSPSSDSRVPSGSSSANIGVAPIPSPRPPLSGRQPSLNGPPSAHHSASISATPMTTTTTNGHSHHGFGSGGSSYNRPPQQKETVIHGYVGFANIPNQVYRKAIKKGFEFTLMVVGQSGLGKSTFINSLFLTDVYNEVDRSKHQDGVLDKTVQVEETTVRLEEQGVNLTLTLVDTPGFGDAVDNSECWEPVLQYIDRKNTDYFAEETKINRSVNIGDKRVHVCLYFIAPSGHGLRALDIEFMKRMHDRVNIIPVIAKADTLTKEECMRFKKRILEEIAEHRIRIYDFPDSDEDDDNKGQRPLKDRVPFAIVGSNVVTEMDGRKVRCRRYPWGVVEVENLEHNDFLALRNMLIRTHMIDLIEVTRGLHFENFRCRQLMSVRNDQSQNDLDPFTQMDDERKKHVQKVKEMESEMEAVFQQKVQEKQDMLNQMQQNLEHQIEQNRQMLELKRKEVAEKRSRLEAERDAYRQENPAFERYISSDSLPGKDKRKKHGLF